MVMILMFLVTILCLPLVGSMVYLLDLSKVEELITATHVVLGHSGWHKGYEIYVGHDQITTSFEILSRKVYNIRKLLWDS